MQDIGVGLIGYGLSGRAFHAPYVQVTSGMTLRAVVSRDTAKVQAGLPGMRVVPKVEDLLGEPGIDLVIVASPDEFHVAHALAAIRAGKHALVDKPFATNIDDARKVAAEADLHGRLLTIFQNRRWDADFLTLQRMIADGTIGDIVHFESHFDRWRPNSAAGWKEARAGGSWLDLGPHLVDQALCLFGRPQAISADIATLRPDAPSPDYFHAVLRYPNRRVSLHSSKLVPDHSLRFAVHGSRGSWIKTGIDPQEKATVDGLAPKGEDWGRDGVAGRFTPADDPMAQIAIINERGDYRLFWRALAAAIAGEGPNPVNAAEAIAVMEILDAGLRSSAQRAEIEL